MSIHPAHVMASSALPPAFPPVRIEGELYWDGGIYSNTPIEAVFDDHPRKSSVVFAVQLWHSSGPEPSSIFHSLSRHKDIQYASRSRSHIARQEQIHRLRHVIRELVNYLPEPERKHPEIEKLAAYGCGTVMHIVQLKAPRLKGEDFMKDINFTATGIETRWAAGAADMHRTLDAMPWQVPADPAVGVVVHDIHAEIH
jgi:NTE family protein